MSIAGLSDAEKIYKKSLRRQNDSGELDVFEATRYFSGGNEVSDNNGSRFTQKIMREDMQARRGGRISSDLPMRNSIPSQTHVKELKEKNHKQPKSPGGRLASFLNSLFNQKSSKKKKSMSTTQSVKDEDESPVGRKKRRSSASISHFQSVNAVNFSKSIHSSSSSGFKTPLPTTICKDFRSYSDHKQVVTLSKHNGHVKSSALQNVVYDDKRSTDYAWLDEKLKLGIGFSEKYKNFSNGFSEEKEFRKFNEVDDGADSDSSSDLFELQNCDLGYYSSGLPVYETTNMNTIKRGAPISSGPIPI